MLQYGLMITIAALSVLGVANAAVAASYVPRQSKCYDACEEKCEAQHSCERSNASRNCFINFSKCKSACWAKCPH